MTRATLSITSVLVTLLAAIGSGCMTQPQGEERACAGTCGHS